MSPMYLSKQVHVAFFLYTIIHSDIMRIDDSSSSHSITFRIWRKKSIHIIQTANRFLVKMNTFNISNEREQLGLNVLRIQITRSMV